MLHCWTEALIVFKNEKKILISSKLFNVSASFSKPRPKKNKSITCLSSCKSLDSEMPSGVHVFAVLLHAHLAGRAIRTRHFRQQVELQPLASDDQFDFNFQEFQPLSQERIILPVSQNPFQFHNLHCSIWGWNRCVALITRYSEPHSLLYSFWKTKK